MVEIEGLEVLYFCPHCGWRLSAYEPCKSCGQMPISDFIEISEKVKIKLLVSQNTILTKTAKF